MNSSNSSVNRDSDIPKGANELNARKRKLERLDEFEKETTSDKPRKLNKQSSQSTSSPTTDITNYAKSGCYCTKQNVRDHYSYNTSHQDSGKVHDVPNDDAKIIDGTPPHSRKWLNLKKICMRSGPFNNPNFKPSFQIFEKVKHASILIVGAGGLGCEILKNLAMMGFENLSIIDMDRVDLSNLNRQILYRRKDIGRPKVEVAAEYIRKRISGCGIKSYFNKIEDFDQHFYQKFHIVICGLDTISSRKWINGMLLSLLTFDGVNDELNCATVIPFIDGGTEGFKGNSRIILPGISPCIDCLIDLYPPQTKFHLCTLANTPRLPEHCVEYVKLILWPRGNPWGRDTELNEDDHLHVQWIYEKSCERALNYGISGVSYEFTLDVLKNIIPAVASTNAVIGAVCATEAFKIATNCFSSMKNHLYLNDQDGVYTHSYEIERKVQCPACSNIPSTIEENLSNTLESLIDSLKHNFNVKNPSIRANINGKLKMLYMPTIPAMEEMTRANLKKSLGELGFEDKTEFIIADKTFPKAKCFQLKAA